MRLTVFRLLAVVLLCGLVVPAVRAIPEVDVRIVDIRLYDDTNTDLLVVLQVYRDVSSVERIIVRFVDPDTTLTRATIPFTNLPFDANGQVRLRVPISNLPAREFLMTIEAQNPDGNLSFETSTDIDLSFFAPAVEPLPTTQPTTPTDSIGIQSNWMLIVAAGGILIVVVVAGFIVWRRQRKPAEPPSVVQRTLSADSVFISYSRTDWDTYVEPMAKRLTEASIPFWLDQHLLKGGDDWMDHIDAALRGCQRCILCVSPDALTSRYVKLEYRYFFNQAKAIYPLMCRPADLPAELQGIQYYDYKDLDQLIALLKGESASATITAAVIRHSPGDTQPDALTPIDTAED